MKLDIVKEGGQNGAEMVIRFQTRKGTEVFGLGIPNVYMGEDWDLGPTWCYLITGKKNILIDTGRWGNADIFKELVKTTGIKLANIDTVIITHSHEDHDGNLADLMPEMKARVWAHELYRQMIAYHPDKPEGAVKPHYAGSCRLCAMPDKFNQSCIPYQQKRSRVAVSRDIVDGAVAEELDLSFIHLPGHTIDSLCTVLEGEILFSGDTLLPEITPHPSLGYHHSANLAILPESYRAENKIYGLGNFIRSLNRLLKPENQRITSTFPAHRLYFKGKFNQLGNPGERAAEIIRFHISRCEDIIRIADGKTVTLEEVAERHFPPRFLKAQGRMLAINEIAAHTELMEELGDFEIRQNKAKPELSQLRHTGSRHFNEVISSYLS